MIFLVLLDVVIILFLLLSLSLLLLLMVVAWTTNWHCQWSMGIGSYSNPCPHFQDKPDQKIKATNGRPLKKEPLSWLTEHLNSLNWLTDRSSQSRGANGACARFSTSNAHSWQNSIQWKGVQIRVGHAYAKYAKYADYAHMRNMRMRIENLIHIFHIQREKTSLFKRQ